MLIHSKYTPTAAIPSQRKATFGAQDKIFKRSSEGKFIIQDSENPLPPELKKSLMMEGSLPLQQKTDDDEFNRTAKKHKGDRLEDDDETETNHHHIKSDRKPAAKNLSLVQIRQMRKNKQESNKNDKMTGKDYRAKRGGGDLKKNSKYEPFAYIKLDPKLINKRFSHQALDQFKTISGKNKKKTVESARKKN